MVLPFSVGSEGAELRLSSLPAGVCSHRAISPALFYFYYLFLGCSETGFYYGIQSVLELNAPSAYWGPECTPPYPAAFLKYIIQ